MGLLRHRISARATVGYVLSNSFPCRPAGSRSLRRPPGVCSRAVPERSRSFFTTAAEEACRPQNVAAPPGAAGLDFTIVAIPDPRNYAV